MLLQLMASVWVTILQALTEAEMREDWRAAEHAAGRQR